MCRVALRLLLLGMLLGFPQAAAAVEVPRISGHVNDYAGLLRPDTVLKLERYLAEFERSDSTQLVVLTIASLDGAVLEEYALKVAEHWGIGQKGKDNGALLLIARDERKIRIEVGYGLEGQLTDLLAGRIIDLEISPRLRAGDFDGGVVAGVVAMAEAVRGDYQGTGGGGKAQPNRWGLLLLLLFLGPGVLLLGSRGSVRGSHRRGGYYIGGPFGGGGGGFGGGGASGGW